MLAMIVSNKSRLTAINRQCKFRKILNINMKKQRLFFRFNKVNFKIITKDKLNKLIGIFTNI